MTKTTIAARPMVVATDGASATRQSPSLATGAEYEDSHMLTMFPLTLFPYDKYPVIATRM